MKSFTVLLFTGLLLSFSSIAQVNLPAFFADKMVLQQKNNVKIWGTATGKDPIVIRTSWNSKVYKTNAEADGKWLIKVETPVAGGPYSVSIAQKNKIVLNDVMIGEVWICSGQSNMDMPVKGYLNLPVLGSNDLLMHAPNPKIRLFHVAKQYAAEPKSNLKGSWEEADISSARDFSAVGYQFATFIQQHLGVPVGMIQASWGGSPIEAWMDKAAVNEVLKDKFSEDKAISKAVHQTPSNLYNAMIAPLVGYGIAGVLWYQGEQNRHNYNAYAALQSAMVSSWRKHWDIGNWSFYYVQIAPMYYPVGQSDFMPRLREVQLKLMDVIPASGMAVSIDAGESHNIHPPDKTVIAKRLAYWAISETYQKKGIAFRGPEYESMQISADTVKIQFKNIPLGMTTFGKKLTQFEVAGKDKTFYPASAILKGRTVLANSEKVKEPVAVRYAFKDWATGELYNVEGLPASSFRTDDW